MYSQRFFEPLKPYRRETWRLFYSNRPTTAVYYGRRRVVLQSVDASALGLHGTRYESSSALQHMTRSRHHVSRERRCYIPPIPQELMATLQTTNRTREPDYQDVYNEHTVDHSKPQRRGTVIER